jgi:hypothetical protein
LSFSELSEFDGPAMAADFYDKLAYPFIRLFLSVVL